MTCTTQPAQGSGNAAPSVKRMFRLRFDAERRMTATLEVRRTDDLVASLGVREPEQPDVVAVVRSQHAQARGVVEVLLDAGQHRRGIVGLCCAAQEQQRGEVRVPATLQVGHDVLVAAKNTRTPVMWNTATGERYHGSVDGPRSTSSL